MPSPILRWHHENSTRFKLSISYINVYQFIKNKKQNKTKKKKKNSNQAISHTKYLTMI